MHRTLLDHNAVRAAILASALEETVAELRLIDAGDLISYIKTNKWANISDLVQSSSELSFKDGALIFACTADYDLSWQGSPRISLDMEIQTTSVAAFFSLLLDRHEASIDLHQVWFATTPEDDATGTRVFADAVAEARVPTKPLPTPSMW